MATINQLAMHFAAATIMSVTAPGLRYCKRV
jgi:hypothetical protein